jgi:molybdopterin-containing oxidoreductase family membrane subunit
MFLIAAIIQLGMWTERFVIVITSLHRDFVPSSWGMYYPTLWDYATLAGTIGFFLLCFLLFAKLLPVISISEMRELVHSTDGGKHSPRSFSPSYVK